MRTLLVVALVSTIGLSGCGSQPKPVSEAPVSPSRVAGEITQLELSSALPDPESFRATLYRSEDGTLGGQVYVYRKATPPSLGVVILAVTPSGVTTVTAPDPGVRPDDYRGIRGGTVLLYEKIPGDATALRVGSLLQGGTIASTSTVWLDVPLDDVPVRDDFPPPAGGSF